MVYPSAKTLGGEHIDLRKCEAGHTIAAPNAISSRRGLRNVASTVWSLAVKVKPVMMIMMTAVSRAYGPLLVRVAW